MVNAFDARISEFKQSKTDLNTLFNRMKSIKSDLKGCYSYTPRISGKINGIADVYDNDLFKDVDYDTGLARCNDVNKIGHITSKRRLRIGEETLEEYLTIGNGVCLTSSGEKFRCIDQAGENVCNQIYSGESTYYDKKYGINRGLKTCRTKVGNDDKYANSSLYNDEGKLLCVESKINPANKYWIPHFDFSSNHVMMPTYGVMPKPKFDQCAAFDASLTDTLSLFGTEKQNKDNIIDEISKLEQGSDWTKAMTSSADWVDIIDGSSQIITDKYQKLVNDNNNLQKLIDKNNTNIENTEMLLNNIYVKLIMYIVGVIVIVGLIVFIFIFFFNGSSSKSNKPKPKI